MNIYFEKRDIKEVEIFKLSFEDTLAKEIGKNE